MNRVRNPIALPQVVILAGGMGTRIRPVVADRPKILIPVNGRPFIEWQFDLLARCGVKEILLCVGHFADQIERHAGDGSPFGIQITYSHEEPDHLMGTGGALVNALPLLREKFMVLYGDSFLPIDYREFAQVFDTCGHPATMSVFRNNGKWDHSNVRIEKDRVVLYDKQAPAGAADCIDYGLIGMSRSIVERYRQAPMPLDMAVILDALVRRGELGAWMAPFRFYEIGSPAGLAELETYLQGRK